MLESIGALSIIAILIYLFFMYLENKDITERERKEFIKHSWTAKILIQKYQKSVREGSPIMSKSEYDKKIKEILNNKEEKEEVRKSIERDNERAVNSEKKRRKKRKVGYKYDDYIFSIFNNNRELEESILIEGIINTMKISNLKDAENIFNIWIENDLVSKCHWNKHKYEVGDVLTSEYYKIDDDDIVWRDWLKEKNIELKPISTELNKFLEDNPLPF